MASSPPLRLNLGAGGLLLPGYVNVDRMPGPGIEVVHDLDTAPWPWPDESAERIDAKDVFEHLNEPVLFMTECWRILQIGGTLRIHTPHWRFQDAYTDPTHKRFPTEHTFDYWIPGTVLYEAHNRFYGGVTFEAVTGRMDGGSMDLLFAKIEKED
jgi:predicted SAM-dependent methyltransferase